MRFNMPSSENVVSSQSVSEKKKVHDVYILDASGSMSGRKFIAASKGIQDSIKDGITNQEVEMITTVCVFASNHQVEFPVVKTKVVNADHVNIKMLNGMTALRDAIGKTFELFKDATENVLIKIFTDGGENDSKVFTQPEIAKLIAEKKAEGWTITFMGTKEDVANVVRQFSIDASNTLVHDNTAEGVAASYQLSRSATVNYSKSLNAGENVSFGFFNSDK